MNVLSKFVFMEKDPSVIASLRLLEAVSRALAQYGPERDDIEELYLEEKKIEHFVIQLFKRHPIIMAEHVHEISSLDARKKVEEFVKEGKYDFVDNDINSENFPSLLPLGRQDNESVTLKIVRFDGPIRYRQVISGLSEIGLRTATLFDLFILSKMYYKQELDCRVLALGSAHSLSSEPHFVPYLDLRQDKRKLGLELFNKKFDPSWAFLAIP